MIDVDLALARINAEECARRRLVRGKDLNGWLAVLDEMILAKQHDEALDLLGEIMDACETLEQYDPREPHPYWYERAAGLLRKTGQHGREMETLARWLDRWPDSRPRPDFARERIRARLEDVRQRPPR